MFSSVSVCLFVTGLLKTIGYIFMIIYGMVGRNRLDFEQSKVKVTGCQQVKSKSFDYDFLLLIHSNYTPKSHRFRR